MPTPSPTPLSFPLYFDGILPSWALDFRMLAEDESERLAIDPTICYHGLLCYQQDNETMYIYINTGNFNTRTNTANDWKEFLGDVQLNVSPNTAVQFASGSPGVLSGSLDFVYDYNNQRVGLGLSNPTAKLDVRGTFQQGTNVQAKGEYSHAEGGNTTASGSYSHAEGVISRAFGTASHAEGGLTEAYGNHSHTEGYGTDAYGNYSHAEGYYTDAYGDASHAEGHSTIASGSYSHAEGGYTTASGIYSHAEGYLTHTYGLASHAEGLGTIANGNYQLTIGRYNIPSSIPSSFIIGNGADNSNRKNLVETSGSHFKITGSLYLTESRNISQQHLLMYDTVSGEVTYFTSSLTIGGGGTINVEPNKAIQFASGSAGNEVLSGSLDFVYDYNATTNAGENGAVGIGTSTPSAKLDIEGTFQQGIFTQAIGIYSHAQGYNTTASGSYSHAEGNNTIASGSYSRSEGIDTIAYGENSHAEGNFTKTYGNSSHAEGYNTIAYGDFSHAEGYLTTASGSYSHAEGVGSISSGSFSHAEGGGCISIGDGSNSRGWNTIAIGQGSNSSGQETISYADFETTIGRFNKDFGDGGRLFTVGNGITTNRNDILTISQIPLNQNSGWATGGIRMIDTNVIISGSRGVIVTGTHATAPSMYNKPESGSVAVLSVFNTPNSTIQVGSNSPTTAWGWINQDPTQDATTGILTGYQTGNANTVINDVSIFAEGKILSRELLVFSGGIKHLSDIRFKKNINEIKIEDATKLIKEVKPVTYNWDIKDDKSFSSGFIAQDFVKAGFEHIVSTTPNDEIKEYIDGDIKFYEG